METVLYYLPGSRAQRVRWTLEELELPHRLETVDIFKGEGKKPEYLALHPLGQLPAITVDGEAMFESGAIVQWLADSFPDKGLSPTVDSPLRRAFNQWMYFSVTSLEMPAWELMLHGKILAEETAVRQILPFATDRLHSALTVLDEALRGRSYLVDDRFSVADIMVAYLLNWHPDHIAGFNNLKPYLEYLQQRPAYLRSVQD